jgi:anti-sigma factor RsiW
MITSVRRMITCQWTARRIQRYLDADPSAPLTSGEIARLEAHLAECDKCTRVTDEHRTLHRALSHWPGRALPDEATVTRLRSFVEEMTTDEASAPNAEESTAPE